MSNTNNTEEQNGLPAFCSPKFLKDRKTAKIRIPRYDGWYWWRACEYGDPVRYYVQFEGRQATSEHGGAIGPTKILGGEWGWEAPDPNDQSQQPATDNA